MTTVTVPLILFVVPCITLTTVFIEGLCLTKVVHSLALRLGFDSGTFLRNLWNLLLFLSRCSPAIGSALFK